MNLNYLSLATEFDGVAGEGPPVTADCFLPLIKLGPSGEQPNHCILPPADQNA